MFWDSIDTDVSPFTELLKKDGVGVMEVLEHPSTMQEARFMCEDLFNFFNDTDRCMELLRYTMEAPLSGAKGVADTAAQLLKSCGGKFLTMILPEPESAKMVLQFLESTEPMNSFSLSMLCQVLTVAVETAPTVLLQMLQTEPKIFQQLLERSSYPVVAKFIADFIVAYSTQDGIQSVSNNDWLILVASPEKLLTLLDRADAQLDAMFEHMCLKWRELCHPPEVMLEKGYVRTLVSVDFVNKICEKMFLPNSDEDKQSFPFASEVVFVNACQVLGYLMVLDNLLSRRLLITEDVLKPCAINLTVAKHIPHLLRVLQQAHSAINSNEKKIPFLRCYFATLRMFASLSECLSTDVRWDLWRKGFVDSAIEAIKSLPNNCYALTLINRAMELLLFDVFNSKEGPCFEKLMQEGHLVSYLMAMRESCSAHEAIYGAKPIAYEFLMALSSKVATAASDRNGLGDIMPPAEQRTFWKDFIGTEVSAYRALTGYESVPPLYRPCRWISPEPQPELRLEKVAEEVIANRRMEFTVEQPSPSISEAVWPTGTLVDNKEDTAYFKFPGTFEELEKTLAASQFTPILECGDPFVSCSVPSDFVSIENAKEEEESESNEVSSEVDVVNSDGKPEPDWPSNFADPLQSSGGPDISWFMSSPALQGMAAVAGRVFSAPMAIGQCLRLQLEELEALRAIYCEEKEMEIVDDETLQKMRRLAESDAEAACSVPTVDVAFRLRNSDGNVLLEADVHLPRDYPLLSGPSVLLRCQALRTGQLAALSDSVRRYIEEQFRQAPFLLDMLLHLQESLATVCQVVDDNVQPRSLPDGHSFDPPHRLWIWSHHIHSIVKRKNLVKSAKEFDLTGFVLPGKPGIICVEGRKHSCHMFWERVHAWTWHRITIKHVEEGDTSEELGSFRKFQSFQEISFANPDGRHMDFGAFRSYLLSKGCDNVFVHFFGLDGKSKALQTDDTGA